MLNSSFYKLVKLSLKGCSGGELSRMFDKVRMDKDEIETLIFDEIDVGLVEEPPRKYQNNWLL